MIILDTLLIGGLRFVLDKIAAAVDAELDDDTVLREELLAAQMRLELGEITERSSRRSSASSWRRIARDPGAPQAERGHRPARSG